MDAYIQRLILILSDFMLPTDISNSITSMTYRRTRSRGQLRHRSISSDTLLGVLLGTSEKRGTYDFSRSSGEPLDITIFNQELGKVLHD